MTELIQGKIHQPKKSKKVLPDIKEIVKQRIEVGIAIFSERELYYGGDLDDSEYSDEAKEQLLAEIKQVKENKKRFAKLGLGDILIRKETECNSFAEGVRFVYDQLSRPLSTTDIIKILEEQIENEERKAKAGGLDPNLPLRMLSSKKGIEYGLAELKKALGKSK
jgi:hypothetical protein